ncbi:adenylate/guanylate cyclase domain-containing protein [Spirochaetia bacterium]|nr:adenylate/guanylate cyclase domain-containing protein [Spirochaetia bacterium]
MEAERSLSAVRSNALVLLDTLGVADSSEALLRQATAFFFERNQDIAAIIISAGESSGAEIINNRFFQSNELDPSIVGAFLEQEREAAERCRQGEHLLINAASVFRIPVLAIFYPRGEGGAAIILFSSETLNNSFGGGVNVSFLINDAGDILVHPDNELVLAGANAANQPFVAMLRESSDLNLQTFYTDQDGKQYFGAFQKIPAVGAAVITSVEYDVVFEGTVATTRRNGYLAGAVLFASVIVIWFFSKTISGPLKNLTAAARKMQAGKFELNIEGNTQDELGVLADSFNQMSNALGVFGRFTNREVALRAMRGEIRPGGESKNATVFFSDIRNFTAISETFTTTFGADASNKIIAWLNEYFTSMVDCVEKTNGVVDKFIGDSVMAHWGTAYTSGSPAHDALNCVRAALMMRNRLAAMNRRRETDDPGNPHIRIGCGINSGLMIAGQLGSDERMEYTVIGDTVNLASRTEALNKPLATDILITENTWSLIKKYIIVEEMPPVRVKGKKDPVRFFAVVNLKMEKDGRQIPPRSLAEVRNLLGLEPPDLSKVDLDAEEKKYTIGAKQ